jgi:hypothetical protein
MHSFFELTKAQRTALKEGFLYGGLEIDSTVSDIKKNGGGPFAAEIHSYLQKLITLGGTDELVIHLLKVTQQVVDEQALLKPTHNEDDAKPRVVFSPPRDESKLLNHAQVAQDLISNAKEELWISTYSFSWKPSILYSPQVLMKPIQQLKKDLKILLDLLEHIQKPNLEIKLLLQFLIEKDDYRSLTQIEKTVGQALLKVWPSHLKAPKVYHQPSAIVSKTSPYPIKTARQHSKTIIADRKRALITSANLSQSAYHSNIEIGYLLENEQEIKALMEEFQRLINDDTLAEVILHQSSSALTQNSSWLNNLQNDEHELSELELGLLTALAQLKGLLPTSPLIDQELDLDDQEYTPKLCWPSQKIAVYCLPMNLLIDLTEIRKSVEQEIKMLKQLGWYVFLLEDEHDLENEVEQIAQFLN